MRKSGRHWNGGGGCECMSAFISRHLSRVSFILVVLPRYEATLCKLWCNTCDPQPITNQHDIIAHLNRLTDQTEKREKCIM